MKRVMSSSSERFKLSLSISDREERSSSTVTIYDVFAGHNLPGIASQFATQNPGFAIENPGFATQNPGFAIHCCVRAPKDV